MSTIDPTGPLDFWSWIEPVPFSLPRISRSPNQPAALIHLGPVHCPAATVQRRERPQHDAAFVFHASQRRQHSALLAMGRQAFRNRNGERRVWPNLEEQVVSIPNQLVDGRGETNGPSHVVAPIPAVERERTG